MQKVHDVIIVGGGPAGLFAAYHLAEHSSLDVLLIEKGRDSLARNCPLGEEQDCIHCKPCNILSGMGGAGLFSDGKLNFIPKLGKTDLSTSMDVIPMGRMMKKMMLRMGLTPDKSATADEDLPPPQA